MHATLLSDDAKKHCKQNDKGVYLWTAGHRAGHTPEFQWWLNARRGYDTKKRPMNYVFWGPYQPDNEGGHQNCVYMDSEFLYHDEGCHVTGCFVCESRGDL